MKELNQKSIRQLLLLIVFAVLFYTGMQHLNVVLSFLSFLVKILFPFILGLVIAFVLNVPVTLIEKRVGKKLKNKEGKTPKWLRICSICVSLLIFLLVMSFVVLLVVPELAKTVSLLVERLPSLLTNLKDTLDQLTMNYPEINEYIASIQIDATSLQTTIESWVSVGLSGFLNTSLNVIIGFFSGIMNIGMSFIFAIYILSEKEKLGRQVKGLLVAYGKQKHVDKLYEIASMSHKTFTNFITGQCAESVILGILYFLGMTVFGFPYALPISVLVALTAMIPIFGAFISASVGALLIFIVSPVQAIWFIVFFVIVQQVEASFIYPKVVGKSVSLPAMWVMLAVMIGGSLFGIVGMLISVPISSILYALLREATKERLRAKKN